MAGSECGGRDCGNPNIKREEKKSKAPQSRKPPHQAPIQRGSSGVMSRLPATGKRSVSGRGRGGAGCAEVCQSPAQTGEGVGAGRGSGVGGGTELSKAACPSTWAPETPELMADRFPSLIFLSVLSLHQSNQKQQEARHPLEFRLKLALAELPRCATKNTRKWKHFLFKGTLSPYILPCTPQQAATLRSH